MTADLLRAAAVELRTGIDWCDGTDGPLARLLDAVADADGGYYLPAPIWDNVAALAEQIVLDPSEVAS